MSSSGTITAARPGLVPDGEIDAIGMDGDWMTLSSERILWVPPEYRPSGWASRNGIVVLGSGAGRVTIFHRVVTRSLSK